MDMIQAKPEIDFVELALEDVRRIAVAIAASCTFISVTHECFCFREVEVLSAELIDKGVPKAVIRQALFSKAAEPQVAMIALA